MKKLIDFFKKKKKETDLLVITQKDINSVPTVIYQGKKIPLKQRINFEWDTKDLDKPYGTAFSVQYTDDAEEGYRQITECYTHPSKTELLEGVIYTTGLHAIAENEQPESIIPINNK
ncbi:hypothetical protein [Staphylococcus sp. GDY8P131P]|uniref:hypothetical protein n=1 Tax=Staphylococcus sp. GDY8P131P TaxID=2804159 RepID=UPI001AEC18D8|nr:hypothetical protein [Staphylococcus sp. GDY8P131P]